ncbi:bifunctional diaminohydroxyphosphoribosylaminopyrimidine deaminase/5-amino-6-(5-phosphoribosylamino)uracil reductase RibD [Snodgrassella sp. ESL0253]|uniref:bifunctional diaminohydroxyphosphoribosylaminopyrimidine deaminase/5-amino-6-(5-phosphoribosylamino)uracil reductase RibD n=1 Tax=Snodgrassella sp. ESL0253 TaxID=2705031 RepID=UPI001583AFB2|nr:bifunctional diaminohydroxyphosphoribosylaminopyrimidine deaminase/5-amino-6-(5-phosphoribosylamino)uracil reductase RibD [Snodgrassella sp. ESL0253]NUE67288.1 bifunctional diaminohydroxyphosphoribosylaminopyrimidine deaminase/5-amino-6-(5-phosphoribosylamino)uracil reductase RibD [Snodgrassella sp. ESL0253]
MSFSELDKKFMQTALELAWQGRFSTSPNPRVGCVITRGEQIVGEGFHVRAGQAHAEVHALRQAGQLAQDATAYVTLEPCSHTGRTGPCAQALIDAHIKRVVVAMSDPNPLVKGNGLSILQQAGIQVDCGLYTQQARELNPGFLSRLERHRPYIRLKIAASLDSKTALSNGLSQWITGEAARNDVQTLRAESCAVLTGINTILADNPQLNVRRFSALRQPLRIILDSKLRITPAYQVIHDVNSPTLIVTTVNDSVKKAVFDPYPHVSILTVPTNQHGQIDLQKLWPALAQRDIGLILVEAGSILNSALLAADAVDEIIYYQAPKILGAAARNAIELAENPQALIDSEWQTVAVEVLDQDCRWSLRHQQSTAWLTGTVG